MASPAEKNKIDDDQRNWADLPLDITASILSRLTVVDILKNAQFVCKSWREVSKNHQIWKKIQVCRKFSGINANKLYCNAIDRSSGQIVDVDLEYFGDNKLLKYICDRSNKIKRLRIYWCDGITDERLIKNVAKLPLLEELELGLWSLPAELFEALGLHCRNLSSLTLISLDRFTGVFRGEIKPDTNQDMIAIGKHIPRLRSLRVVRNLMTDEGLEAILYGCTVLESLDLHNCVNISVQGKVWERCTKQIKRFCRSTVMDKDRHLSSSASTSEFLCGPCEGDSDDDYYD